MGVDQSISSDNCEYAISLAEKFFVVHVIVYANQNELRRIVYKLFSLFASSAFVVNMDNKRRL